MSKEIEKEMIKHDIQLLNLLLILFNSTMVIIFIGFAAGIIYAESYQEKFTFLLAALAHVLILKYGKKSRALENWALKGVSKIEKEKNKTTEITMTKNELIEKRICNKEFECRQCATFLDASDLEDDKCPNCKNDENLFFSAIGDYKTSLNEKTT